MSLPSRNNPSSASKPKSNLGRRSFSRRPSFNPNESKLETICEGGSKETTPQGSGRESGVDVRVGDVSVNESFSFISKQSKSFLSMTDSLMDYSILAEPFKVDVALQAAVDESTPPFVLRKRLKSKTDSLKETKEELNELSEFTKLERQVLSVEGLTEAIQENKSLKSKIERQSEEMEQLKEELAGAQRRLSSSAARTSELEYQGETSRAQWASRELQLTSSLQEAWDKLSSLQGDSETSVHHHQPCTPLNLLAGDCSSEEKINNERLKHLELLETSTREFLVLLTKQLNSDCDASTSQEDMRVLVEKDVADLLNQVECLRKKSEMDSSSISEKTAEMLAMSEKIKILEDLYSYDVDLLSHDHDVKIHHLEDEVEQLKTDNKELKNQLSLATTEITALNEYIAALTCQLEENSLECKSKCSELLQANLNVKKLERYCSQVYDMYETNMADLLEEKERLTDRLSKEMRQSSCRVVELEAEWSRQEERQSQLVEQVGGLLGSRDPSAWPPLVGDLKQLVEHLRNQLDSTSQQLSVVTHNNTVLQDKVILAEQLNHQLECSYTLKINALTLLNENLIKESIVAKEEMADKMASLDSLQLSYSQMMNTLSWERDLVINELADLVAYDRNQTNPIEALVPLVKERIASLCELVEHMKNKIHSKEDQLNSLASVNQQLKCSLAAVKGEAASKEVLLKDSVLVIRQQKDLIQSLVSQLEQSKSSIEQLRTSINELLNCKELIDTLSDRLTTIEGTVSSNRVESLLRAELAGFDFASEDELVVAVRNLLDGKRDLIEHLRNQVSSSKQCSSVLGNQYASHLHTVKSEADSLRAQLLNFTSSETDFIVSLLAKLELKSSPSMERDAINDHILVAVDELIRECTTYREESESYQHLVAEKTNQVNKLISEMKLMEESLNNELDHLADEGSTRVAALHHQIEVLNNHTHQLEDKVKSQASRLEQHDADVALMQTQLQSNIVEMNSMRVAEKEILCRTLITELSGLLKFDNNENFECLTSTVKSELNRYTDLVEHLRNQLGSKETQLSLLRGWNQELTSNLSCIELKLQENVACGKESVEVIQEQRGLIDSLVMKLRDSETQRASVDEQMVELESLEDRVSGMSRRLSSLESEHSKCSEVLTHLMSEKQLLIEEFSHFIDTDSLHQQGIVSAVSSEFSDLHLLLEHLRNLLTSKDEQLQRLAVKRNKLLACSTSLEAQVLENNLLIGELNCKLTEFEDIRSEMCLADEEKLSLENQIHLLEEELVDYDKCQELMEHLRNKLKSGEEQLNCLTESKQSLEQYIHELEINASVSDKEASELREELSESNRKLEKLKQRESANLLLQQEICQLKEEIVKQSHVNNVGLNEAQMRGFLCRLQALLGIEEDSSLVLEEAMQSITEITSKAVQLNKALLNSSENNQKELIAKTELINQLEDNIKLLEDIHRYEIDSITDKSALTYQSLDANVLRLEDENAKLSETVEAQSARLENYEGLIAVLSCELEDWRLKRDVPLQNSDNEGNIESSGPIDNGTESMEEQMKLARQMDLEFIEHMRNKQQSKDQQILSLKNKLKTLLASLSYVESQLSDKHSIIEEMGIRLNRLDKLKSDLDCAVTENVSLKSRSAELKEELTNLEQLTEHLRNSLQSKEQLLMAARVSNDRLTESLALLEEQVNEKQFKINDLNMKISSGELDEIKSMRNEKLFLLQEVQSLREQQSVVNCLKSCVAELTDSLKMKEEQIVLLTEANESAVKSLSLTEEELLHKTSLIEELRSTLSREKCFENMFSNFIVMLTNSLGLDAQTYSRDEMMSIIQQKVKDLQSQLTQVDEFYKFEQEEASTCNSLLINSLEAELSRLKKRDSTLMEEQTARIANQDGLIAVLQTDISQLSGQVEKHLNEKEEAAREMMALQLEVGQLKCSHSAIDAQLNQRNVALNQISLQFQELKTSSNEAIENLNFEKSLLLETLDSEKYIASKCNTFIENLVEDCCQRLQSRSDVLSEMMEELDLCEDLERLKEEVKELRLSVRRELNEVSESSEELLSVQASLAGGCEALLVKHQSLDLDSLLQHHVTKDQLISHLVDLSTRLVNSNLAHTSHLDTLHSLYLTDTRADFESFKCHIFNLQSEFSNLVKGLSSQIVLNEFLKHFDEITQLVTPSADDIENSAEVNVNTVVIENVDEVECGANWNLLDEYGYCKRGGKRKSLPSAGNPVDDTLIMTVDCDDTLNLSRAQNHLDLSCCSVDRSGTLEPDLEATVSEDPFKSVVCNRTCAPDLDMTIHLLGQMDESRISSWKRNISFDYVGMPTEPASLFAEVKQVLSGFECLNITDNESVVQELRRFVSSLESTLTLARPFVTSDLSDNSTVGLIRGLCAELVALRRQTSSLDSVKLRSLKASCEQLKLDRQSISAQVRMFQDNVQNQLDDLLNKFSYLSEDFKSRELNRGKLESELYDIKTKERKLNEAVVLHEKETQLMSLEIEHLKSEIAVAGNELDSLKTSCHSINSENTNLKLEVESLKEQVSREEHVSSETIDSLRVSLNLLTAEKDKMESEIEDLRAENIRKDIRLSESLSQHSQVISQLESLKGCKDKLNDLDKYNILLKEENDGLRTSLVGLKDILSENETYLTDYNSLKSHLYSLVSFTKENLSNMTRVSKLKSHNDLFGEDFIYDCNDWAAGIKYISEQQENFRLLLEDLIASVEKHRAEKLEVKSLQYQLQARSSELEDVNAKYDSLQREYTKSNEGVKMGCSSSSSVAPELAAILRVLDCDDQLDGSLGFEHVFSKIRKRIELLKEVCESKKQSQEGASPRDDLRNSLTRLESELKESRQFKCTFAQEVHSLKPEVGTDELMLLSLEEMLHTLVNEIMLKEQTIIASLKESYEASIVRYQEKLKQVDKEYNLKVDWSNVVEADNDRLNGELKELKERLEAKGVFEALLEAQVDTLEKRLSSSEESTAVPEAQDNPHKLLSRLRALNTRSLPVPDPVPLSRDSHLSQTNYLELEAKVESLENDLQESYETRNILREEYETLELSFIGLKDMFNALNEEHLALLQENQTVKLTLEQSSNAHADQIKMLNSDLQQAESRLEELTEKIKRLEHDEIKNKEILCEEKGQLDSLMKENSTLKSVIEEKVDSVNKLRLQLEEHKELVRMEQLNYKNDTLALNNKIASLEEQLANVTSVLAQSSSNEQKCTQLSSQVSKLSQEMTLLKSNHEKDLERQKELFSSKLKQSTDVCASLKRYNIDFQAIIKNLEDKLKETNAKHFEESENLRHQLSRMTEKNELLLSELALCRNNEAQRILIEKEKKELVDYSNQLRSTIKSLEDERKEKESLHYHEVTRLNKEVSHLNQEMARLSAEIDVHTAKMRAIEASAASEGIELLRQQVVQVCPGFNGDLKDFIIEKLQELQLTKEELTEEKQKAKNLDEECDFINKLLKESDRYLNEAYEKKEEVSKELKALQADNKSQNTLICNLGEELKLLKSKIKEARTKEQTLLQQINKGGEECKQCEQMCLAVSRLEAKLKEAEVNMKEVQAKLKEAEAKLKEGETKEVEPSGRFKSHRVHGVQDENKPMGCDSPRVPTYQSVLKAHNQEVSSAQAQKIVQQEERIKKLEKDREILKRLCESRFKTIQQLKSKA